jgi:hypothetical protein
MPDPTAPPEQRRLRSAAPATRSFSESTRSPTVFTVIYGEIGPEQRFLENSRRSSLESDARGKSSK